MPVPGLERDTAGTAGRGERSGEHRHLDRAELRLARVDEHAGQRHRELLVEGIQFHPESIASEHGKRCLQNFIAYRRESFPFSATLSGLQKGAGMSRAQAEAFITAPMSIEAFSPLRSMYGPRR